MGTPRDAIGRHGAADLESALATGRLAFPDRALDFPRQHLQMIGEPCEQLALGHVGGKLADQRTLLRIVEELFQMRFHVLHNRPQAITEGAPLWTATRREIQPLDCRAWKSRPQADKALGSTPASCRL